MEPRINNFKKWRESISGLPACFSLICKRNFQKKAGRERTKIFREIIAEKFPNFMKNLILQF